MTGIENAVKISSQYTDKMWPIIELDDQMTTSSVINPFKSCLGVMHKIGKPLRSSPPKAVSLNFQVFQLRNIQIIDQILLNINT